MSLCTSLYISKDEIYHDDISGYFYTNSELLECQLNNNRKLLDFLYNIGDKFHFLVVNKNKYNQIAHYDLVNHNDGMVVLYLKHDNINIVNVIKQDILENLQNNLDYDDIFHIGALLASIEYIQQHYMNKQYNVAIEWSW